MFPRLCLVRTTKTSKCPEKEDDMSDLTMRDRAYHEAMRLPLPEMAEKLQDTLGQRITAYAIGIKDGRQVGKYARGETKPSDLAMDRLRRLYQVVQILSTRETAETIRAWMIGSNPLLEGRAPLELLHEDQVEAVAGAAETTAPPPAPILATTGYRPVLDAAESFITAS